MSPSRRLFAAAANPFSIGFAAAPLIHLIVGSAISDYCIVTVPFAAQVTLGGNVSSSRAGGTVGP
jgi:hypothetical protein